MTTPAPLPNELLSVKDAATRLGISPRTVYTHVTSGRLPHYRIGRRYLFDPAELDRYLLASHRPAKF